MLPPSSGYLLLCWGKLRVPIQPSLLLSGVFTLLTDSPAPNSIPGGMCPRVGVNKKQRSKFAARTAIRPHFIPKFQKVWNSSTDKGLWIVNLWTKITYTGCQPFTKDRLTEITTMFLTSCDSTDLESPYAYIFLNAFNLVFTWLLVCLLNVYMNMLTFY
jgi:hypothetical protein